MAAKRKCFWMSNSSCSLPTLGREWILEFLAKSPIAREDILSCSHTEGCNPNQEYLDFAKHYGGLVSEEDANDAWMSKINQYKDVHRLVQSGFDRSHLAGIKDTTTDTEGSNDDG